MSGRHLARRNVRGGVAVGAALAAVALTSVAAYNHTASADTAPSCAEAITTYQQAVAHEKSTSDAQTTAAHNDRLAQAKRDKAITDAQGAYTEWLAANPEVADNPATKVDEHAAWVTARDAQLKIRDAAVAKANQDYSTGGTAAALSQANSDEQVASGSTHNAKAAADTACTGPSGVDAKIILSPGVCARARITPDTAQLLRVIVLIPCPPATPPAPPVTPGPGAPVVVIPEASPAPVPDVVQNSLPVTH